jgi:hypothetical protein
MYAWFLVDFLSFSPVAGTAGHFSRTKVVRQLEYLYPAVRRG